MKTKNLLTSMNNIPCDILSLSSQIPVIGVFKWEVNITSIRNGI